jgi:hypothetical protein
MGSLLAAFCSTRAIFDGVVMVGTSIQESVESEEVDMCVFFGEVSRLLNTSVRGETSDWIDCGEVVVGTIDAEDEVTTLRL